MNNNNDNKIRRKKVSTENLTYEQNISNEIYEENNQINRNKKVGKRTKKIKKANKKILESVLIVSLVAIISISVIGLGIVLNAIKDSPIITKEELESNYVSSEVVSSEEISQYLKDAVVSIEDERFYEHNGVDIISLLRSLVHNILTDTTQGGSTLEMQLSKNLLTTTDKTINRKIKDIYNAYQMDRLMTKDEILTAYLNNIYLGKSSYGVGKGSKVYFGKDVSNLTLAECAMLAGITNNPAKYMYYDEAKQRQEIILNKMKELGYITEEEYKQAIRENVTFKSEID